MSKYIRKKITCACCKKEQDHQLLAGHHDTVPMDLDTNRHNPVIYDRLILCPFCGYAGYANQKQCSDSGRKLIQSEGYRTILQNPRSDKNYMKAYLAAWIQETEESYMHAAYLYLQASWRAKEIGMPSHFQRQKAILNFEKYLTNTPDMDAALVMIDCLRQNGRFEEAVESIDSLKPYLSNQLLMKIADYERFLCEKGDTKEHSVAEVRA